MINRKLSEAEVLLKLRQDLYLIDSNSDYKESLFDEVERIVPGMFHLNSLNDFSIEFMNSHGVELLHAAIEDIRLKGVDLLREISSELSFDTCNNLLYNFVVNRDMSSTLGFFQKLKFERDNDYNWYYTVSKLSEEANAIISITNPVSIIEGFANEIRYVLEREEFFEKNFLKFTLLTKREKEILKLTALGKTSKSISEILFLSFHTVNTHKKNINKKLETNKLSVLVKYAEVFKLIN